MAKQLNIKLNFQADTSQAERALLSLNQSLNQISSIAPTAGTKLNSDLTLAKQSALDLQKHLTNAFNVKTGNLDLKKLDNSLKSSGQSLGQLSSNLLKAGTAGESAFLNIQRAIGNASIQINQANGLLAEFWTTLKNTARWQLSSSILHGFMGGLQSAWGYAKELDKSLNDIRIVTGYSSDKMAKFAEEANKAAKALSTNTTSYTNAALIYYQQGLSDDEVLKRTDITVKMANVSRQSAEVVSDQMTSIWNNFYDGSKSLEYYADVLTALGAATASSTEEIAGGLEKFAAIGETIGLSYEYAASALATITSNTRQSEEVVGTALKTIFARIQGLNLGETLEDGTSLNKYSEALQKVGISIFEQNGELKNMDNILEELATKWKTLNTDQQTALAQTVAGVRQYTQLMALMNNWNKNDSDSMISNLNTVYESEGSLDIQAEIYAESWEASMNRVKAASEDIYRDLFPTEKMTDLADGFSLVLEGVDGLILGLGGVKGILALVSSLMLSTFQNQIGIAIDDTVVKIKEIPSALSQILKFNSGLVSSTSKINNELHNVQSSSKNTAEALKISEQAMAQGVSQALNMSMEMTKVAYESSTLNSTFNKYNTNLMTINNTQSLIEKSTRYLTNEQQQQLVLLQQQAQTANEQLLIAQQKADEAEREKEILLSTSGDQVNNLDRYTVETKTGELGFISDLMNTTENQKSIEAVMKTYVAAHKELEGSWSNVNNYLDSYKSRITLVFDEQKTDLTQVNQEANKTYGALIEASNMVNEAVKQWPEGGADFDKVVNEASQKVAQASKYGEELSKSLGKSVVNGQSTAESVKNVVKSFETVTTEARIFAKVTGSGDKHLANIEKTVLKTRDAYIQASVSSENFNNKMAQVTTTLSKAMSQALSFGHTLSSMASGFSSVAMGINSVSNAINTINDEDASFTSKLTAGAMATTMSVRGLMSVFGGLNTFIKSVNSSINMNRAATLAQNVVLEKNTQKELENLLVKNLGVKVNEANAAAEAMIEAARNGETAATIKNTAANWANVASQAAKYWWISLLVIGIAALAYGIWKATSAEEAETKALQAANKELENAKNAYDNAKESAAAFKDELSSYDDSIKGLKELTAGTEEMSDAVEEANKKARQLIETYKLFQAGDYSYGVNGEIIISQEAKDRVLNQQENIERKAQTYYYSAEIGKTYAQLDYDNKKIADEFGTYKTAQRFTKNPNGIYDYGEYIDVDSMGNYVDLDQIVSKDFGVAKYYNENNTGGIKTVEYDITTEHLKQLSSALQQVENKVGHIPATADEFITEIEKMTDHYGVSEDIVLDLNNILDSNAYSSLLDFCDNINKASEASQYYSQQLLGLITDDAYSDTINTIAGGDSNLVNLLSQAKNAIVANTNKDLSSQYQLQQEKIASDIVSDNSFQANDTESTTQNYVEQLLGDIDYDEWLKSNYNKIFTGTSETKTTYLNAEDMGKAYVESQGYTITNIDRNKLDGSIVYKVVDAKGNPEEFEYGNQEIADAWASQIANYALNDWAQKQSLNNLTSEELSTLFSNIIKNSNQYGADFKNPILAGIADNSKTFDFSSVYGELSKEEIDEIRNMSGQQIGEKFLGSSDINTLTDLGFQSWHQFANAFKAGLDNWDPSIYIDSMNEKYEAIAKEKNIDVGTFKAYRKSSEAYEGFENDTGEEYGKNWLEDLKADNIEEYTEALNELAIMQTRLSKGYKTLGDNWKDWNKVMSDSEASIDDINEIMPDLNEALADILNWDIEDIELLPHDFAKEHWDVIQDIYNGVDGAHEKLAGLATHDYILSLNIDTESLDTDILTEYNKITSWLQDMPDLEIGMSLNDAGMYEAFQALLDSGVITKDQMNDILSQIGYEPVIKTKEFKLNSEPYEVNGQTWVDVIDPITGDKSRVSGEYAAAGQAIGEKIEVPAINGEATIYRGGGGSSAKAPSKRSSGGGGGGSKKKTSEARKDKTDVVDRYKEVNDKLEETQRLMDKNNTLADGLWGPDKIALMKENIKLMEKENKYLQEKYELSKKYLAEDKAALEAAAADVGINFTFNNDDNISNYTEQMTALFNQREALLDSFGEEMDEKEQERLDEFDKKVEALKSAYELYEKTLDEKKDLEEEHLEKMLAIQEEYYNVLNEELEVKVSINESDLEIIDYYLNKISDDFYQMAEAAALMVGSLDDLSSGKVGGQMAEYFDGLDIQKNYLESLEHDYNTINPETGTTYINQQQYIEGLRESRSEIINNLSAINDLDKEMLDYYANTLSMASDELDKFTSKLEHQTSVLEHYKTIMDVLGKSQDYEAMGIILEGQVTTVENELKIAEETYKLYRSQADDKRELYEQAIAAGNQAPAELYKREWEAAEEAATEAQDNMLSKTEEWAEAMKTVLRNSLDGFADELEKALTGGSSFDYINTQMERAASLQEEYLTTTNKIYETNKLMRKAQQEIDKTTNTVAKQRLKDFIKETDQLQDKSQLSKYELEIQQAKYDLLLAEIALQEAQNAKSTVRLQRDSEGNFGYVYTADQNEIDNAEQALEDAQNNLYNIGLRGATEYVEKYNQTMSAMYDTFRELEEARFNNEISQDEYNQRMLEAQEYYYQELSNFQDLYGIALDTDSRVYQDAWTSAFTGMMDSSEVWKDKVTEYSENAQTAFEDWATKVDEIAQRTGLDDISEKVKEVTNDSEELKNTILGDGKKDKGVIGALEEELNAVSNLTEEYGSLRGMIQGLIKDYGGLLTAINNAEHAEAEGIEDDSKTEGAPSSTSDSNSGNSNEDTGGAQTAAAPSLTTGSQIQVKPGTRWYGDSFGGGSSGSARGGTISYINENGSHPYNIEGMGWIKKTDIVGYDTGGYTGSWEGSYGKLAFLHQKELILNAKDTENLLKSMDFLNNIISTIDLYSANAQLGSALMNPYINNTNTKDTLEQRVYIEASFPGVSDHNELEEAFNNLINTASQYANRK